MPEKMPATHRPKTARTKAPGCGALMALSVAVIVVGGMAFLAAAITEFNAWWNSPADTAAGQLALVLAMACFVLLLLGWVGHFLAPHWMYRWSTLLTVVLLFGLGYVVFGREYRALAQMERREQLREQGQPITP